VLESHMEGFKELAQLLLEKEVIFAEDLERIYGPRVKLNDGLPEGEAAAKGSDAPAAEGSDAPAAENAEAKKDAAKKDADQKDAAESADKAKE
ncbi:MAG: cell division protein FtsH, partial [Bacteroidales bacterium]|nr:cell division protein FtsH [Bacteroidales bacterium]